ncbi:MAG: serine hydrolase [Pseudomonadota bacterium]
MLRVLRWLVLGLVGAAGIATAGLLATGNSFFLTALSRTYLVGEPTANINDHRQFETRTIPAGEPQPWPLHPDAAKAELTPILEALLAKQRAAAFLVIKDGQLLFEHYRLEYTADSRTNSFSMAKTIVTLLLGIAIQDGLIDGLDQPLTEWLPELANDPLAVKATVGSLSTMTSGYDWDERYYSPFSPTVELYYSSDVTQFLLKRSFAHEPGEFFYYSSASTQLLATVLTRALQRRDPAATLSAYLSEKLWVPLGMNAAGLWHVDGSGMELGYCCINTNARNFAKFGELLLHAGQWQGESLVASDFVVKMVTPAAEPYYGYSTWLSYDEAPPFFALRGHLGQYVIVVPSANMIVVRLGEERDRENPLSLLLPVYVREALSISAAASGVSGVGR